MSSSLGASKLKDQADKSSTSISNDSKISDSVNYDTTLSNSETGKKTWLVGDIVWSKIPGHPWWPSMVAYEPNTAVYYKYSGRVRYYHVQFFGHEPMRGWATEKSILLYEGKEHFMSLKISTHGKAHKLGNKQVPLWETAIKMADKALPMNRHERKLCFTFKYNKEQEGSEVGPFTEILNGFIKNKVEKDSEISLGEPKTSLVEKGCNGVVVGNNDCQPSSKKAKVNLEKEPSPDKLTNVKERRISETKQTSTVVAGKKKDATPKTKKPVESDPESATSLKLTMKRIDTPVEGKRKRGRPRKYTDFVIINAGNQSISDEELNASTPAKKQKTAESVEPKTKKQKAVANPEPKAKKVKAVENSDPKQAKVKSTLNNVKLIETEKVVDTASDSNSNTSTDIEVKTENTKQASSSKQKEMVCVVCEQPENLMCCEGICNSAYHVDCLGLNCDAPDKFICDECTSGNHTCFICRKTNNVVQCSVATCGKFYHVDCIRTTSVKIDGEKFCCPLHYCNVCGPQKSTSYKRKLTCCTRCPTAYHSGTCIVAGCLPITSQYLVCKRHFLADKKKAHHSHVNVNWCFVCSIGGTLICCESCPAAFHAECIDVDEIPEGHFFCRDCITGKELLYGEIVWVKLGMYRWWPAQICNPNNIPANIQNLHHQPGEFPVQFLGSHDYYWIHRGRVFSYQEGDKGSCSAGGKYLGNIFRKALVEAKDRYMEWQKLQEEKAEKDLEKLSKKPAAYKHLKVNRYTTATRYVVDESEWSVCECSLNDENPCGPDSHCLNRLLLVECSPAKCPAKEKCQNQCFVKRQYLDSESFRTKKCGWGLRATQDAKKGQFIIEYVGELISEATCRERVHHGVNDGVTNYYMLTIDKDCIIDAGPMANLARFMNHCCDPNCETQKWTVNGEIRVGLFAKRDITAGDELVFDYQLDCLGNEKKQCSCGSQNCSGFLGVRPKTQHAQLQEEKKKKADLKKKKKKAKKNQVIDVHEDECFNCGDGGELIMCDKTGCSKCYHLLCITLHKKPTGCWLCPWHFCDDCGKAATMRCSECSNSFCSVHAVGQIIQLENGPNWCLEHTNGPTLPSDADTERSTIDSDRDADSKKPGKSSQSSIEVEDSKNLGENVGTAAQNSENPTNGSGNSTNQSSVEAEDSKNLGKIVETAAEKSENPANGSGNSTNQSSIEVEDSKNPGENVGTATQNSENPTNDSGNSTNGSGDSTNQSSVEAEDSKNLGKNVETAAHNAENSANGSGDSTNGSWNFANGSANSTNGSENSTNVPGDSTNGSENPTNILGNSTNNSGNSYDDSKIFTSDCENPVQSM